MITIFNSETAYVGTDVKRFNEVREELEKKHIKYKYKVRNQLSKWNIHGTVRGTVGNVGNPLEQSYEYEILIHKRDK